ncbi:hypothetical protein NPX13_g11192 [Xylaria arbuscula]|uniref:Uncharacterized protein n=1 Tax=Xylaria arbuscula TaxID=114810 RepID=A0A9W8TH76_9PEZI|nr:hypothetical protein NPX13_g11192 [Xylaria arbuscula]
MAHFRLAAMGIKKWKVEKQTTYGTGGSTPSSPASFRLLSASLTRLSSSLSLATTLRDCCIESNSFCKNTAPKKAPNVSKEEHLRTCIHKADDSIE